MKVEVNDAPHSQKELLFELPYEVFESASNKELDKILPSVKVPGFRPGKAPKELVKRQQSNKIKAAAIERVINDAMQEGLTVNGIRPLSQPNVSNVVFEDGKPITFKAVVDVFPTMHFERYKGFDFDKKVVEITDDDVDSSLQALQTRHVTYEPVRDRDAVQNGDIAVIDFVGKIDGKEFENGSATNFSLNIGSGQFIAGFEDGVIGMKSGETKDVQVTFPADYGKADLANKPATFTVTVHEIKEKITPALDDEFAKDVNSTCDTLDKLKLFIKKGLAADAENNTRIEVLTAMLNKIIAENPFDVPYSFIREQAERLAYTGMSQFYQMGLDPEKVGINFEMMVERYLGQAEEEVKRALVITELARTENIAVSDEDVDKYIAYHADLVNSNPEDLKKDIDKNGQMEGIKNTVLSEKVCDFLLSNNNISEVKLTREEFEKLRNSANKKTQEEAAGTSESAQSAENGDSQSTEQNKAE